MSKIRIVLIILLIGGLIVGGLTYLDTLLTNNTKVSVPPELCQTVEGVQICQDENKTLQIAIFDKPITVTYEDTEAASIKEQSILNKFALAVNGSYFRGSYVESEHAGLLQIKGEAQFQAAVNDLQLTHVAVYDEKDDQLSFEEASDFNQDRYDDARYTLFQTGPLMISSNQVQSDLIAASNNGKGKYLRSVLGYTNTGEKFLLITKANYDLATLSQKILELPMLQNKQIFAINLDGGTSTAMYVRDVSTYNFGESKRLPSLVGVTAE